MFPPNYLPFSPLPSQFRDMRTIKLANLFLGQEITQGKDQRTAMFFLTGTAENTPIGNLFKPQQTATQAVSDPLTNIPVSYVPDWFTPATAMPYWDEAAKTIKGEEFSFKNTVAIADEVYKLDEVNGMMTTIVFSNLAWLMKNYSTKDTIDCGDWCWFQQQHSDHLRVDTEKQTREVLFGPFKTMSAYLTTHAR